MAIVSDRRAFRCCEYVCVLYRRTTLWSITIYANDQNVIHSQNRASQLAQVRGIYRYLSNNVFIADYITCMMLYRSTFRPRIQYASRENTENMYCSTQDECRVVGAVPEQL